jgi:hypothetical protein
MVLCRVHFARAPPRLQASRVEPDQVDPALRCSCLAANPKKNLGLAVKISSFIRHVFVASDVKR